MDDEPLLTAGLAMLLGAQADMEVAWQATDGHQALWHAQTDPVDVILLDVQMPGLDGLATTHRLIEAGIQGRIVILTTFDVDEYVMGAIEAGAAGFLLKNTPPERLIEAVRTVHAGDCVISPGPTRRLLTAVRTGWKERAEAAPPQRWSLPPGLTERETEILALVARGLTNQEICDRLWLSMATVKTHVSHLLAKTGARDRVQLVLLALRTGVVDLDELLAGAASPG
ncbi:response regulator [Actinomyces ruminicola]|uniref:Two component transcriptional regulator, LuxR family n=1 Tax=Actinomyces ruminicola TaxID=332524 RepID=A0A1G9VKC7_9ACTO|nr:response regulator transcription factor [Actinomyces ruminicola]SDM72275.1 two component transcriptional regulator, LuxR family [Actinomyces ruminicola]